MAWETGLTAGAACSSVLFITLLSTHSNPFSQISFMPLTHKPRVSGHIDVRMTWGKRTKEKSRLRGLANKS